VASISSIKWLPLRTVGQQSHLQQGTGLTKMKLIRLRMQETHSCFEVSSLDLLTLPSIRLTTQQKDNGMKKAVVRRTLCISALCMASQQSGGCNLKKYKGREEWMMQEEQFSQ
jgi:hypothetical protein